MKTVLPLSNVKPDELPPEFRDDDVRFSEPFAQHFIQHFTEVGQVVFDPFAGFGTTLLVAEALGRTPFGLELDQRRAHYIQTRLKNHTHLVHGDARHLATYPVPPFDFSLTSPPYMHRDDPEDPFSAYTMPGQGYEAYLATLKDIYAQMQPLMKPTARAVIEVANLKGPHGVTTLAWDIAGVVGQVLTFEGEIVIVWEQEYGYGYDHSYCLIFRNPSA